MTTNQSLPFQNSLEGIETKKRPWRYCFCSVLLPFQNSLEGIETNTPSPISVMFLSYHFRIPWKGLKLSTKLDNLYIHPTAYHFRIPWKGLKLIHAIRSVFLMQNLPFQNSLEGIETQQLQRILMAGQGSLTILEFPGRD